MRFIDLKKLKSKIRRLVPALDAAHRAVMSARGRKARTALINGNSKAWTALRKAFSALSNGKCWYVECKCSGAIDDMEHFRPKLGVRGVRNHPGYYWLAFNWQNLRLSSQLANRRTTDPATKRMGGKSTHFPLLKGSPRAWKPGEETLERPALLDPTRKDDCLLLTFNMSGEAGLDPKYKGKPYAEEKIAQSIICLHLNLSTFVTDRAALYNKIEDIVDDGSEDDPGDFDTAQANPNTYKTWRKAISRLHAIITDPDQEYSAAARVYVESFRNVWWVDEIVLRAR